MGGAESAWRCLLAAVVLMVATPAADVVTAMDVADFTEVATTEWACPASCFCMPHSEVTCNINGSRVTVEYNPGEFVYLTCDDEDDGDFWRRLPALAGVLRAPPALAVRDCPLPTASYSDIADALGAPPGALRELTLRSAPDAGGLSHTHLARLPALRKLTLADEPAFSLPPDLPAAAPALAELRAVSATPTLPLAPAPSLRTLELARADLQVVARDSFRGQPGLRRLLLWASNVSALEEGALDGLAELDTLDLSSNALRSLPPGLFRHARRLRALSLASNRLGALPPGLLAGLEHLEEVRLDDNRAALELSPRQFAGLGRLRSLRLSRCGLGALPADALAGATSLRSLRLAGNALSSLPERALSGLRALEELDLSDNGITRLSAGHFSSLVALRTLALDGNQIAEFPDGLLDGLPKLEELSAARAGLARMGAGALGGATELRVLRLSHNALALGDASPSPFARLLALQRLELAHNLVSGVPDDWRNVLLQLAHLDLAHNRVGDLQFADINFLSEDITVDLTHNNISRVDLADAALPRAARAALAAHAAGGRGAVLLLDGNPLRCDCALYAVRAGAGAGAPRLELGDAACAAPPSLRLRRAADVPLDELTCSVAAPACPAGCSCGEWPASRTLRLRCGAWPVLPRAPRGSRLALSLAGRGLRSLKLEGIPPPELEEVDLAGNPLSELDEDTARRLLAHNRSVDLAGAALPCACGDAGLLAALAAAAPRLRDYGALRCADGGLLRDAARRRCFPPIALAGVLLAALLATTALAAALAVRHATVLRAWLAARGCSCLAPADDAEDAKYDVFVSHAHEDEALVAGALAPRLEARGLRLCLHFRDWAVGEAIPEQIARSVRESRRTLLVVSPAFARSEWARLEMRAARAAGRAAVVLLGDGAAGAEDPELTAYLREHTYVKWGDPWFWDKLLFALPRPRPAAAGDGRERAPPQSRLQFSDRLWGARGGAGGGRLAENVLLAGAGGADGKSIK